MHLGNCLRIALAVRNKTPTDLARELGSTSQQVGRWRQNESWNTKTLFAVCSALSFSVDDFINLESI